MPLASSRARRSRAVKIELLVSTRNRRPCCSRAAMNSGAPGMARSSRTSTPSMSVSQQETGGRSIMPPTSQTRSGHVARGSPWIGSVGSEHDAQELPDPDRRRRPGRWRLRVARRLLRGSRGRTGRLARAVAAPLPISRSRRSPRRPSALPSASRSATSTPTGSSGPWPRRTSPADAVPRRAPSGQLVEREREHRRSAGLGQQRPGHGDGPPRTDLVVDQQHRTLQSHPRIRDVRASRSRARTLDAASSVGGGPDTASASTSGNRPIRATWAATEATSTG